MTDRVALDAIEVIQQLRAEIERLRNLYSDWREMQEARERADDEIERLRAALREIADLRYMGKTASSIARTALEEKP